MLMEYEGLRNEIRYLRITDKNYLGAIRKCNDYLRFLSNINANEDRRFIFHNIALNNMKLGNVNEAIRQSLISINYIDHNKCDYDYRYASSTWLIAECNFLLGNNKDALKMYTQCSKTYKNIEEEELRISVIFNKARIYKSERAMKRIIKIYETNILNSTVKTYGDMEYDDILTEMYTDLFNLYMNKNKQEAFKLLYILKDKSLRKELGKQLNVA